jgi:polysaccharide export outer membrane protein
MSSAARLRLVAIDCEFLVAEVMVRFHSRPEISGSKNPSKYFQGFGMMASFPFCCVHRKCAAENRRAWLLFALLGALSCLLPGFILAQPAPTYGLQPGDIIRVSVWREEQLDQGVLVRPDGGISFPLAGDLNASGMTIQEVTDAIADRLSQFIPNPVVTVSLQENTGNRIYVTGRVEQPGVFLVNRPVDVMQAIAMAGGLTPFADKDGIKILRRKGSAQIAIPFNYKLVQKGKSLPQNIMLEAGDTLVVP